MDINDLVIQDADRLFPRKKVAVAPQKKKKGFWLDQLSTGGGIGGALGGAAAGAALGSVVPVAGTAVGGILGALLGGGLGSAGGEVAENAITGDDLGKNVLKEGLIGGATSLPIGAGFKLARAGLQAGTGFGKKAAADLVQEAGVQTIGKRQLGKMSSSGSLDDGAAAALSRLQGGSKAGLGSHVADLGTDLQRSAANTTKVAGSYGDELGILGALQRNGLNGSAKNMYKNVDSALGRLTGQVDNELKAVTQTASRPSTINGLRTRVTEVLPDDATYTKELERSLQRLGKSSSGDVTASELFNFKKQLSNRLSPAFKKMDRGASLTAKEEVDMALWRSLDDDITAIAPQVKQLTLDQSKLISARPGLQAGSTKTAGIPILGVKSEGLEQLLQSGRNRAGRVLAGGADAAPGMQAKVGQSLLGTTTRQGLGRALTAPAPEEQLPFMEGDLSGQAMPDMTLEQAEPQVGGYTQSQIRDAMVRAAKDGNGEAFDQLQALFKMLPESSAPAYSTTAQSRIADTEKGLAGLDSLDSMVQGNDYTGGVIQGNIRQFNPFDNDFKTQQAKVDTVRQFVGKALEGGVLRKEDEYKYKKILPTMQDQPEVAKAKLAYLRQLITQDLQNYKSLASGGGGGEASVAIQPQSGY